MGEDKNDFRVGDRIIFKDGTYHGVVVKVINEDTIETKWDDCGWTSTNTDPISKISHDTDIEVGDRIRVTGNNINSSKYYNTRAIVDSIDGSDQRYPYSATSDGWNYPIWSSGYKVSNDTPFTKNNVKGEDDKIMDKEQVTRDGYVYTKLKSLSPKSIWDGEPCRGSFDYYVDEASGAFSEDQDLTYILDIADNYSDWLPWLIAHGYIGKEEVKKEVEYDIRIADKFNVLGAQYIVAQVGPAMYRLIGLQSGNRLKDVDDIYPDHKITKERFIGLLGSYGNRAESIYATKKRG